jgi:hypothetical protein
MAIVIRKRKALEAVVYGIAEIIGYPLTQPLPQVLATELGYRPQSGGCEDSQSYQ